MGLAHPELLVESFKDPRNRTQGPVLPQVGGPLWKIDARVPFVGSPVHERMTVASINLSKVHRRAYQLQYDEAYIHGVFWNDDPDDLLCPECSVLQLKRFDKRWGLAFALRFDAAQRLVRGCGREPGKVFGVGDGLLERSHFGDLQFLHAMAADDGEPAATTQSQILSWAQFAYRVATGDISHGLRLAEIPIPEVRAHFAGDPALRDRRIEALFKGARHVKRAMTGSLLHMVQDSFAPGHGEREILDHVDANGRAVFARGRIRRFHSYANQDGGLHAADDRWPAGLNEAGMEGDLNPIGVGARLLRFVYAADGDGAPWPEVEKYLREVVFAITDPAAPAGPGEKYKRKESAQGVPCAESQPRY